MENEIMVVNGNEVVGAALISYTKKLINLSNMIKKNYLKMGSLFIEIREKGLLEDMGMSLVEYAKTYFNISKSALYRMTASVEKCQNPLLELKNSINQEMEIGLSKLIDRVLNLPDICLAKIAEYGNANDIIKRLIEMNVDEREEVLFSSNKFNRYVNALIIERDDIQTNAKILMEVVNENKKDSDTIKEHNKSKTKEMEEISNAIIKNHEKQQDQSVDNKNEIGVNELESHDFSDDVYNTVNIAINALQDENRKESMTKTEMMVVELLNNLIMRWYEND